MSYEKHTGMTSVKKKTLYVQKLSSENHAIYMIMWKNVVVPDSPQMTLYDA